MGDEKKQEEEKRKYGWIAVSRSIQESWVWNDKKDTGSAWIDMIMMANFKEKKFYVKGTMIDCKPGQFFTSLAHLALRWKWSTKKVRHYLNTLNSDGMIYFQTSPRGTLITIVNYAKYQAFVEVGGKQRTRKSNDRRKTEEKQRKNKLPTTKQYNNDNNVKQGTIIGADAPESDWE